MVVYLDDILVFGRTPEEHLKNLETVLAILRDNQFYAKLSKCVFNKPEVKFLGHIVGRDGLKVNPAKVEVVSQWPRPTDVSHVRQFLGLTNYFRKFIQGYSSMAAPLSDLTKGTSDITGLWQPLHETAFQALKLALVQAPVLRLPDFSLPFEVITDASLLGTGGVLQQDGHPIAFTSKKYLPPGGAELHNHRARAPRCGPCPQGVALLLGGF